MQKFSCKSLVNIHRSSLAEDALNNISQATCIPCEHVLQLRHLSPKLCLLKITFSSLHAFLKNFSFWQYWELGALIRTLISFLPRMFMMSQYIFSSMYFWYILEKSFVKICAATVMNTSWQGLSWNYEHANFGSTLHHVQRIIVPCVFLYCRYSLIVNFSPLWPHSLTTFWIFIWLHYILF